MKEFMLLIHNLPGSKSSFSPEVHKEFLLQCEDYIGDLKRNNNLISAQPMVKEGTLVSFTGGIWKEQQLNQVDEMIVGYYHIRARDTDEAIAIAKRNPEFKYTDTASVLVRPLKTSEPETGYKYPSKNG